VVALTPRQILKERYGFVPTDAWLEHLQKSSVRFNSGGSGSFVSADGLVLSNHHVGADALQKFGDKDHNYPDATFTLRLAFGTVKGYEEGGQTIPFQTTIAGLYQRAADQRYRPPFDVPARWLKRKNRLDLNTPLNFVSTADIIGGNSGSPVVNRNGEFVGIIFDGNLQSLVLDFSYTEEQARALAVHSRAIVEALRKVYDAKALAEELAGGKRKS
jgi:hypothetical protein